MADVIYKDDQRVMVRLRIDRAVFDALETAFGSQGQALRALRTELPECLMWLIRSALDDSDRAVRAGPQSKAPQREKYHS